MLLLKLGHCPLMRFASLRQFAEHLVFFQNDILTLAVELGDRVRMLSADRFDAALMFSGEVFALCLMILLDRGDLLLKISAHRSEVTFVLLGELSDFVLMRLARARQVTEHMLFLGCHRLALLREGVEVFLVCGMRRGELALVLLRDRFKAPLMIEPGGLKLLLVGCTELGHLPAGAFISVGQCRGVLLM